MRDLRSLKIEKRQGHCIKSKHFNCLDVTDKQARFAFADDDSVSPTL